jgi:hypothetical protein
VTGPQIPLLICVAVINKRNTTQMEVNRLHTFLLFFRAIRREYYMKFYNIKVTPFNTKIIGGKSTVKFVLQEQHIQSLKAVMFCFLCWTQNKFLVSLKVSDECVLQCPSSDSCPGSPFTFYYRRRCSFLNTVF